MMCDALRIVALLLCFFASGCSSAASAVASRAASPSCPDATPSRSRFATVAPQRPARGSRLGRFRESTSSAYRAGRYRTRFCDRFKLRADIPAARYVESDFGSVYRFNAASARLEGVRRPIPAICETYRIDNSATNLKVIKGIGAGVDYFKLRAPRLGIFATYNRQIYQPWYWYFSAAEQLKFREHWPALVDWQSDAITRFQAHAPTARNPSSLSCRRPLTTSTSTTRISLCGRYEAS